MKNPETKIEKLVKPWPCVASAVLLLLAFPPFNLSFLVFFALVPWLYSLRMTSRRGAWKSGYFLGLLYGLSQMYFLFGMTAKWTQSVAFGMVPWLAASFAFALYYGWMGILIRKCYDMRLTWLIPVIWAGIEVFRSYIPVFAFPWALIANPLWPHPALIQSAFFGSIYLVSAWVVLANVLIVQLIDGAPRKQWIPNAAAFLLILIVSLARFSAKETGTPYVVTALQPGVDMAFTKREDVPGELKAVMQGAMAVAEKDGTQLVIMPEGMLDAHSMPPEVPFRASIPVIVGARRGAEPAFQSALLLDNGVVKYVDKTRLVIFGEFVPARDMFPGLAKAFKLPSGDMTAGVDGVKALKVGNVTVGPILCFEGLFPDIAYRQALNGTQLLAIMSIDDWYMGTPAPAQLEATSIWRSVEMGQPVVRAASTGVTLITNSKGELIAEAPMAESRAIRQKIILPGNSPFFAYPVFALGSLLAVFGFGFVRRRKPTETPADSAGQ